MSDVRARSFGLLLRLLTAYLVPTLLLLGTFAFFAHRQAARSLEESLGRRLTGVAQATSAELSAEAVAFVSRGDDASRTARNLHRKLGRLKEATGVARIVVLDKQRRAKADTAAGVRIGDRYYQAEVDASELDIAFEGVGASSVLFAAADGRTYKTGYAPLRSNDSVIAVVGVVGSSQFLGALDRLRDSFLLLGAVVSALIIAITVVVARRITRPLRMLAGEAARIGAGELERPVAGPPRRDEVGVLAETMNRMRQDLFERDQQLQMMLSGIAHEVRNPLGGMALFSGLLREELADQPERLELVARIEREMTYLKRVVNDFLEYARRSELAVAPVDLKDLCLDLAQLERADATSASVDLAVEGTPAVAAADHERVRAALLNLCRNAIQACEGKGGGRVVLRTGVDRARVWVEVADDGPGMAADVLVKIFTPFFTTREKGTGLGLALTKKIIDEHGGELSVDSAVEKGTTVRVTLPASTKA